MKTYQSAIGTTIMLIPGILLGGTSVLYVLAGIWPALFINLALMLFIVHLCLNTDYTITGDELRIRSGFFFSQTISIGSITAIRPSKNVMSAPAASLDRLDISYGKRKHQYVSPRDKTGFMMQLKALNPGIIVPAEVEQAIATWSDKRHR